MLPPPETAGSGLAPEVKIRIEIDTTGAITAAEVTEVVPSGPYDEVFRRHTLEQLENWRYAPAIENGVPVARTLQWTLQYKAFSDISTGGHDVGSRFVPPELRLDDTFARIDRLNDLSADERKDLLQRYAAKADKHLVAEARRVFETPNVTVVTDAENEQVAEVVARNIEAALGTVHQILNPLAPYPRDLKTVVYLYRSEMAYNLMQGDIYGLIGSTGSYMPPGLLSFHQQVPSAEALLSVLIHEATHAYSDQHLVRPGFRMPRWFEEGFAEYMGHSDIKKGQLVPGRTAKRQFYLSHYGVRAGHTEAGFNLRTYKRSIKKGEGLPLTRLLGLDRGAFYVEDVVEMYTMSWLFVHFLRHGEATWADGPFHQMVLYLAEGYPSREAIETAYGTTVEELDPRFRDYVGKF